VRKLLRRPGQVPIVALAVVAIAVVSLLFYRQVRVAAFPEHAIQLAVTREEAADRSASFLRGVLDQDVGEYSSTTTWRVDSAQKTYLEKELGVERTTELADAVDLWAFETRYFRPLQKEEFEVSVGPNGRVIGFSHLIDESSPGAHLSRDQALQLAESARHEIVQQAGERQLVDGPSRLEVHLEADRPPATGSRARWQRDGPGPPRHHGPRRRDR
jgi:hypothetical protein